MRLFSLVFIAVLALTACGPDLPGFPDPAPTTTAIPDIPEPTVNAFVMGRLAESQNISERGEHWISYNSSYEARVNFSASTDEGRAVMAVLSLTNGGLDHPDLQVGSAFSANKFETTDNGLTPTIIGCEGRYIGSWSFDDTADLISVDVTEPRPGIRRVNYLAVWEGYGDTVPDILSGFFDLEE